MPDQPADEPPQPTRIIVRFRTPEVLGAAADGAADVTDRGPSSLSALHRRYSVSARRAILPRREPAGPALQERLDRRARRATSAASRVGRLAEEAMARTAVLQLGPGADLSAALAAYRADPAVEWAEADVQVRAQVTWNDPHWPLSGSWGQTYRDLWGLVNIQADTPEWEQFRGQGVTVAVIDTGLDVNHPDWSPENLWINEGEVPGNGLDDDLNGYIDDAAGWDFAYSDNMPSDGDGHGTHVAGTIAAAAGNGRGIVGLAYGSRVMVVKGLDDSGSGWNFQLARAIHYAADNGADVINASWGGGHSSLMTDAVAYAHGAGVVFVAAAGNWGEDVADFSPASLPGAVAVAALDASDKPAWFSNRGYRIDVAAPGVDVLSLRGAGTPVYDLSRLSGSDYVRFDGTSMAAPHVSALAALILSKHPTEYTNEQVRQVIRESADDLGAPGRDDRFGAGRINVRRAFGNPQVPWLFISTPSAGTILAWPVAVAGTAAGTGVISYELSCGLGSNPSAWTMIGQGSPAPVINGPLGSWDSSLLDEGDYTLRLGGRMGDGSIHFVAHYPYYVDRSSPTVSLERPLPGSPESRRLAYRFNFADNLRVKHVGIHIDGHLWRESHEPFVTSLQDKMWINSLSQGAHSFRVDVQDQAGMTASQEVTFHVVPDGAEPVLTSVGLDDGLALSSRRNLTVDAQDDVQVDRVAFIVDGKTVREDEWAPFTATLDPHLWTEGVHRFSAVVVDTSDKIKERMLMFRTTGKPAPGRTIAINAGGPRWTSDGGFTYQDDSGFEGGYELHAVAPVAGTDEDEIYQWQRYAYRVPFSYRVPLAAGAYDITLKFAEPYYSAERAALLDVYVEGRREVQDLDVFAQAGRFKAYDLTLRRLITDGELNMEFMPKRGEPGVQGIVIAPAGGDLSGEPRPLSEARVWPTVLRPSGGEGAVALDRLPPQATVTLRDMSGRTVKQFVAGQDGSAAWAGRDAEDRPVGSGVYFLTIESGGERNTRRIVVER